MGACEAPAHKMPVLCGTFALVPHFDMGYTVNDGKVAQSEGFGSLFCLGRLDCPCPFRRSANSAAQIAHEINLASVRKELSQENHSCGSFHVEHCGAF